VLRYKGKDLAKHAEHGCVMNLNRKVWNAAVPVPGSCRSHEHDHGSMVAG
jgi:hypothetical protein